MALKLETEMTAAIC